MKQRRKRQLKINETKNQIFKEVNKINKTLPSVNKKKRENSNIIRNERGDITTNTTEIQTIRDYYKQLNANKLDNLSEIDKFPETRNLPILNHEETEKLNRLIAGKDTESAIENLPKDKSPGQTASLRNYIKTFKEKLIPVLFQLFRKKNRREHF